MISKDQLVQKQLEVWREMEQARAALNSLTGAFQVLAVLIQDEQRAEQIPMEEADPDVAGS